MGFSTPQAGFLARVLRYPCPRGLRKNQHRFLNVGVSGASSETRCGAKQQQQWTSSGLGARGICCPSPLAYLRPRLGAAGSAAGRKLRFDRGARF